MQALLKLVRSCNRQCSRNVRRQFSAKVEAEQTTETKIHPYRTIHPWKSVEQFSKDLMAGIIFNDGGLIALNKPYGISKNYMVEREESDNKDLSCTQKNVPNAVNYTLSDALSHIQEELGYPTLSIIKSPPKYMSGVMLLATNDQVAKLILKSYTQAPSMHVIPNTYWVVTTKRPIQTSGKKAVALKIELSPCGTKQKPVIVKSWHVNEEKRRTVKKLTVKFKLLADSKHKVGSLLEIESSTRKWNAVRLFAASTLLSPILGDNICGSLVQNIMGTDMVINPFLEAAMRPPKLPKELLSLLKITSADQVIIPTHIHLRKVVLLNYLGRDKHLTLEAPLKPEFAWTCERLELEEFVEHPKEEMQPGVYVDAL